MSGNSAYAKLMEVLVQAKQRRTFPPGEAHELYTKAGGIPTRFWFSLSTQFVEAYARDVRAIEEEADRIMLAKILKDIDDEKREAARAEGLSQAQESRHFFRGEAFEILDKIFPENDPMPPNADAISHSREFFQAVKNDYRRLVESDKERQRADAAAGSTGAMKM